MSKRKKTNRQAGADDKLNIGGQAQWQAKDKSNLVKAKQNWLLPLLFLLLIGLFLGLTLFNYTFSQNQAKQVVAYYLQIREAIDSNTTDLLAYNDTFGLTEESYQLVKTDIKKIDEKIQKIYEQGNQIDLSRGGVSSIKNFFKLTSDLLLSYRKALAQTDNYLQSILDLEPAYTKMKSLESVKNQDELSGLELTKIYEAGQSIVDNQLQIAQSIENFVDRTDIINQAKEQTDRLKFLLELSDRKASIKQINQEQADRLVEIYKQTRMEFKQLPILKIRQEWLINSEVKELIGDLNTLAFKLTSEYGLDLDKLN